MTQCNSCYHEWDLHVELDQYMAESSRRYKCISSISPGVVCGCKEKKPSVFD